MISARQDIRWSGGSLTTVAERQGPRDLVAAVRQVTPGVGPGVGEPIERLSLAPRPGRRGSIPICRHMPRSRSGSCLLWSTTQPGKPGRSSADVGLVCACEPSTGVVGQMLRPARRTIAPNVGFPDPVLRQYLKFEHRRPESAARNAIKSGQPGAARGPCGSFSASWGVAQRKMERFVAQMRGVVLPHATAWL